ncbi:3-isopropylmalate dehydratase small subunit [Salipiger sp.]|uniref:3-isopropylmalate dehydratase small subunit n=1 Tax=Salipiger sp. TaxID=2078585 RepID=UPI003A984C2A
MPGWTLVEGRAVALPIENIDTDQLIPARFMSTQRAEGYGRFLLHDLARGADGTPDPAFPLNRPESAGAKILVTRRNFGAGSSREAAVYALVDAGFRVVIAPSFGDIFSSNAINNGLLPARLSPEETERLIRLCPTTLRADLESLTLRAGEETLSFELDPVWREKLMKGWDDVDLTLAHGEAIAGFADARRAARPWTWPG